MTAKEYRDHGYSQLHTPSERAILEVVFSKPLYNSCLFYGSAKFIYHLGNLMSLRTRWRASCSSIWRSSSFRCSFSASFFSRSMRCL